MSAETNVADAAKAEATPDLLNRQTRHHPQRLKLRTSVGHLRCKWQPLLSEVAYLSPNSYLLSPISYLLKKLRHRLLAI